MRLLSFTSRFDWVSFGAYLTLSAVSLLTLFSLGQSREETMTLFVKQLSFFVAGLACIFFLWRLDYRMLRDSKRVVLGVYGTAMLGLAAVLVWGVDVHGAKSWFRFGEFGFQPIEFAKIALILVFAKYLSWYHVEIRRLPPILVTAGYAAVPVGLTLLQPDFGSAVLLVLLWLGMMLISGINRKQLGIILLIGLLVFVVSWVVFFKEYQKTRILTFLNVEQDPQGAAYNRDQALVAIGSGGVFGRGLGHGTQARFGFLPEAPTDFMFATIGEEWGLVGILFVLGAFCVLFFGLARVAMRAQNNFGRLFIGGFMMLLLAQVVINGMMNLGMFPIVGIQMPFISYGGSGLLFSAVALGVAQSVGRFEGTIG